MKTTAKHMFNFIMLIEAAGFLALSGCVTLSSLQSPKVIEPKQQVHGVALGAYYDKDHNRPVPYEVDIYGRFGIARHWDVGYKVYGLPFLFGVIQGDVKYQFLRNPIMIAGDLGISYAGIRWNSAYGNAFGLCPMLLIGYEHFYLGAKTVYVRSNERMDETDFFDPVKSDSGWPGITLGGVIGIGKGRQIVPEISLYWIKHREVEIFPGIGFQIRN